MLPGVTGLSPEGVELALVHHLETNPSDDEITALLASVEPAERVWVVPSAGVFVAVHRALALGLAASAEVFVKPSRREPHMAQLLAEAAPGLFTIAPSLDPREGDAVFAYGRDVALESIRAALPAGVRFHPHGAGIGVAFVDLSAASDAAVEDAARRLTDDVVPFDQRGCLSPRIAVVRAAERPARTFVEVLSTFLAAAEVRVPLGRMSSDEASAAVRYRDTMRYAGDLFPAGSAFVGLDVRGGRVVIPPPGRNVHVVVTTDVRSVISPIAHLVTAAGIHGPRQFAAPIHDALPRARKSDLGYMQRPSFDGPVDRRGL
jgi:hypothetical protein